MGGTDYRFLDGSDDKRVRVTAGAQVLHAVEEGARRRSEDFWCLTETNIEIKG